MDSTKTTAECSGTTHCYAVRDMPQVERIAFLAWFGGGSNEVTSYANKPDDVSWGKSECERVPFREFWLGKMVEHGWFTFHEIKRGIAKGMVGTPEYVKYKVQITDAGWDAREAFYHTA